MPVPGCRSGCGCLATPGCRSGSLATPGCRGSPGAVARAAVPGAGATGAWPLPDAWPLAAAATVAADTTMVSSRTPAGAVCGLGISLVADASAGAAVPTGAAGTRPAEVGTGRSDCDGGRTHAAWSGARGGGRRPRDPPHRAADGSRRARRCRHPVAAAQPAPGRGRAEPKPGRAASARSAPRDRRSGVRLVEPVPERRRLTRVREVQKDQDRDGDDRREADVISDGVDELMDR